MWTSEYLHMTKKPVRKRVTGGQECVLGSEFTYFINLVSVQWGQSHNIKMHLLEYFPWYLDKNWLFKSSVCW